MPRLLLIPVLYAVFAFLLYRWNRKHATGLSSTALCVAYGFKVAMGILYGYIFLHYYKGDDTWYFHNGSIEEYQKLLNNPWQFIADFNPLPAFERNESFERGWYYYLSDLEFWLITKPMAIFNFISGGNYYVNVVFFNFIVCWGLLWLFQLYAGLFPEKKTVLYTAIFLMPGLLFWLSGIRGDGLIAFFLGLLIPAFYRFVHLRRRIDIIYILLALAGITILRSMILLVLVPALIGWFITVRFRTRAILTTAIVYGSCIVVFFGSTVLSPKQNLPAVVAAKQADYFRLTANTRFALDTLKPTLASYMGILPQSINNTFLRPYPWEAKGFLQVAASLEMLFIFVLILLAVVRADNNWSVPPILFPLSFAVMLYVFIGYTIPFPGAIIRYKVIGLLFILVALSVCIQWKKQFKLK